MSRSLGTETDEKHADVMSILTSDVTYMPALAATHKNEACWARLTVSRKYPSGAPARNRLPVENFDKQQVSINTAVLPALCIQKVINGQKKREGNSFGANKKTNIPTSLQTHDSYV